MTKFTKFLSDDTGKVAFDWAVYSVDILLLGFLVVLSTY